MRLNGLRQLDDVWCGIGNFCIHLLVRLRGYVTRPTAKLGIFRLWCSRRGKSKKKLLDNLFFWSIISSNWACITLEWSTKENGTKKIDRSFYWRFTPIYQSLSIGKQTFEFIWTELWSKKHILLSKGVIPFLPNAKTLEKEHEAHCFRIARQ